MIKLTSVFTCSAVLAAAILSGGATVRADGPAAGRNAAGPRGGTQGFYGFPDWDSQQGSHRQARAAADWDDPGDGSNSAPRVRNDNPGSQPQFFRGGNPGAGFTGGSNGPGHFAGPARPANDSQGERVWKFNEDGGGWQSAGPANDNQNGRNGPPWGPPMDGGPAGPQMTGGPQMNGGPQGFPGMPGGNGRRVLIVRRQSGAPGALVRKPSRRRRSRALPDFAVRVICRRASRFRSEPRGAASALLGTSADSAARRVFPAIKTLCISRGAIIMATAKCFISAAAASVADLGRT